MCTERHRKPLAVASDTQPAFCIRPTSHTNETIQRSHNTHPGYMERYSRSLVRAASAHTNTIHSANRQRPHSVSHNTHNHTHTRLHTHPGYMERYNKSLARVATQASCRARLRALLQRLLACLQELIDTTSGSKRSHRECTPIIHRCK